MKKQFKSLGVDVEKKGLPEYLKKPIIFLEEKDLQQLLKDNSLLISVFKESVGDIGTHITEKSTFMLTDREGILVEVYGCSKILEEEFGIIKGVSLKEESYGTNAISLFMDLKESVYLKPVDHYNHLLKRFYCYTLPLRYKDEIVGYLDVSTINKEMSKEMIAITKLLKTNITNTYIKEINLVKKEEKLKKMKLTNKQLTVLKLLSQGLTEVAVANEMNLNVNTIKYHKKNIFEKFNVKSSCEAITHALKFNIL